MPILALSGLLTNLANFNIQGILITILILCISLSFHEAAHAWAAYRLGDDTAALQGRLTLNPLAHLDPIGALVFLVAGIGWAKPVPINPTRFNRKYSMKTGLMLTSLAGPSANLLLAIVAAVLHAVTLVIALAIGRDTLITTLLASLFFNLYWANTVLAIFNLLPMPPLDGYKIFGAILPNRLYYSIMKYERYIGLVFLALVLFGGSILSNILQVIRVPFDFVLWTPIHWLAQQLVYVLGL